MRAIVGVVRGATLQDLPALLALEKKGFPIDQYDKEQLRYLLTKAHATNFVVELEGVVRSSAIMLWRKGSGAGRLYSIVTDPAYQGLGLGSQLLLACEQAAIGRGCSRIALEVRRDNGRAIAFYKRHGYQHDGVIPDYYADGVAALEMTKPLEALLAPEVHLDVPYYPQTLGFTCGPACLMMAMKHFRRRLALSRSLELVLWKEATLTFMTSGVGGCGPFGLAVAAQRRGFPSRVVLPDRRTPFLSSVRTPDKKAVVRLMHDQLRKEARALGVRASYHNFAFEDIAGALRQDMLPIVLISASRLQKVKAPHWVVVTGFDSRDVYFHDPFEGFYVEDKRQARDVRIPIPEFRKMRRYGSDVTRSVVFVGRPPEP